jgi:hypothetical protein
MHRTLGPVVYSRAQYCRHLKFKISVQPIQKSEEWITRVQYTPENNKFKICTLGINAGLHRLLSLGL